MRLEPLAVMRPDVDVDCNDAALAEDLAKARSKNRRSAMRDAGLDDDVWLQPRDRLLIPHDIGRQLNDRNAEPGEGVDVFLIPPDLEPEIGQELQAFVGVEIDDAVVEVYFSRRDIDRKFQFCLIVVLG